MSVRNFIGRRRCLGGMLAALALVYAGSVLGWRGRTTSDDAWSARRLLALLDRPRDARAIGRACLRALPEAERSAAFLVAAICADASLAVGAGDRPAAKRLVAGRVRQEFAQGTMVAADGWLLSRTEARLYALAALA